MIGTASVSSQKKKLFPDKKEPTQTPFPLRSAASATRNAQRYESDNRVLSSWSNSSSASEGSKAEHQFFQYLLSDPSWKIE